MPAYTASAPGKIILFGEHAVVYGRSAIAVPVADVMAKATISPAISVQQGQISIDAPDIGLKSTLNNLPKDNPIAVAILSVMRHLEVGELPSFHLKITSSIPVASGLGSGAAVSVAIIRTLAGFLGQPLSDEVVSKLTYEVELIHHGTPSGIDNTVITYEKPVFFTKSKPTKFCKVKHPFTIIIGDTGIQSPTKQTVAYVRAAWEADRKRLEKLFSAINSISKTAKKVIEGDSPSLLGSLMDENHLILQEIGVSSPKLDQIIKAAKDAGAIGAKLSGGGRGGNMIALVDAEKIENVREAICRSGAKKTITTVIK